MTNIMLLTDSYKQSHWKQYPPKTNLVYSYFESRGGKWPQTVFFGLQYYLKKYLEGNVVTQEKINEAEEIVNEHMGAGTFNREGWEYILHTYGGRLPLRIKAVPEGTVVPISNVLMTVENTDDRCYWLTNFVETLLVQTWYPSTVATNSRAIKKDIYANLIKTGDPAGLPFKLHDFGFRGVTTPEQAGIGGCAHLVNFLGTDTLEALRIAKKYYSENMAGFSIPASEHSTITSWGKENEVEAMRNMLEQYPTGLVACVSDSFDIYNACRNYWGGVLRDKVLARNGTLVIRPDCYDDKTEILTENGWKLFKNLSSKDKVAEYTTNGEILYNKPRQIIKEKYKGEMLHFKGNKKPIDLLVTPNHNMVYRKSNTIKLEEAQNISFYHSKQHLCAGKKRGEISDLSWLDRLKIAYQADGSSNKHPLKIRFNFAKKRKFDRLVWICKNGGFDYKVSREKARPQNYNIYVTIPESLEKTFTWVSIIDKEHRWCQEFIEEASYWDCCRRSSERFKYDTTVPINAEVIQLVAINAGYKTYYSTYTDNRKEHFSDTHTIHIHKKDYVDSQGLKVDKINYDGYIYCVKVNSGMLVVRRNKQVSISGNSGNPPDMVVDCLNILGEKFGAEKNSKGYKVLNPKVRLIQGDGIDAEMVRSILYIMTIKGWSGDNLAFGSGGGLLQKLNRDTSEYAFKCAGVEVDGLGRDVYKEPVSGTKRSKGGRLKLLRNNGGHGYTYITRVVETEGEDVMEEVFRNGKVVLEHKLSDIRERAKVNEYRVAVEGV